MQAGTESAFARLVTRYQGGQIDVSTGLLQTFS